MKFDVETSTPFHAVAANDVRFGPAPLAAGTVIAGNPQVRSANLADSDDGLSMTMAWDCTAGRFRWDYDVHEIVHIVEGEVQVQFGSEPPTVLRAGDVAYFHPGTSAVWQVDKYVRKVAFCQRPLPRAGHLASKIVWKLQSIMQRYRPKAADATNSLGFPSAGSAR